MARPTLLEKLEGWNRASLSYYHWQRGMLRELRTGELRTLMVEIAFLRWQCRQLGLQVQVADELTRKAVSLERHLDRCAA